MNAALQNANGPDEVAPSIRAGSNPLEMGIMNSTKDSTAPAGAPVRPIKLQLIDICDLADDTANLVDALDMATADILDRRQRKAMAAACAVIIERMDDLKEQLGTLREALA